MRDIVPEYLQLISSNSPLLLDRVSFAKAGKIWGWLGPGRPISPTIIQAWLDNKVIEPYVDEDGKEYPDCMLLSEFGVRCAKGEVKASELKLPETREFMPTFQADDKPEEGTLLFTSAGTCRLCSKKMDIFGQISHAKSHINKGDAVFIEEVNKKKYARIREGAVTFPAAPESFGTVVPLPPVEALQRKQELDGQWSEQEHPTEAPDPIDFPGYKNWVGRNLFSMAGQCRLCKQTYHIFAFCTHAKGHIRKGDPVEIVIVKKKSVPMVLPGTPDVGEMTEAREAEPDIRDKVLELAERDMGIQALVTLQEIVGNEVDREALALSWDKMDETDRNQTLRAAEIVSK